jgi:hypothetical protein
VIIYPRRCCSISTDGFPCQQPDGHEGDHYALRESGVVFEDERQIDGSATWTRERVWALRDAIGAQMSAMSPELRLSLMSELESCFCRGCGARQPERKRCQCQNDE